MTMKRSKPKNHTIKWADLMNEVRWEDSTNWRDVRQDKFGPALLRFKEWIERQSEFLLTEDYEAFKLFFAGKEMNSNLYTRKNKAVGALVALYKKEKAYA